MVALKNVQREKDTWREGRGQRDGGKEEKREREERVEEGGLERKRGRRRGDSGWRTSHGGGSTSSTRCVFSSNLQMISFFSNFIYLKYN